jgi:hypothetical protein
MVAAESALAGRRDGKSFRVFSRTTKTTTFCVAIGPCAESASQLFAQRGDRLLRHAWRGSRVAVAVGGFAFRRFSFAFQRARRPEMQKKFGSCEPESLCTNKVQKL